MADEDGLRTLDDGPFQRIRSARMWHIAENESIRRLLANFKNICQRDPGSSWRQYGVVLGRIFILRDLPGKEPCLIDLVLIHMRQNEVRIVAVPVRVIVRVDSRTSRSMLPTRNAWVMPISKRM